MTGEEAIRVGILKLGCIGAASLIEYVLDERAERNDIEVRSFTSGAKMDEASADDAVKYLIEYKPAFAVVISPNAALPGPSKAREALLGAAIPTLTISDAPSAKAFYKKNEEGKKIATAPDGQGFLVLTADSMIGARKEFLDPTEMVLFNSDMLKVLAGTGYMRLITEVVEDAISATKGGKAPEFPLKTIDAGKAVKAAGFTNPYARAKAYAAATIAEKVADVTTEGCFKTKEPEKYIPLVAAGHELLRAAAILADDARELEKGQDAVYRTPHGSDGKLASKTKLLDKPK
ncbi:MAG: F420-dependent methylenetetrahydromethanopterin dehydrogenase [Candidatus Thorarchaeota archaeon]|nr:F420-dependent methylenetetrahydromethanopterin dehydrogenase [Candidatus Thorarchaeota archaeon]